MSERLRASFAEPSLPASGAIVVLLGDDLGLPSEVRDLIGENAADAVVKAAAAEGFKGKSGSGFSILAPAGLQAARLVVVGVGGATERASADFVTLGGTILGKVGKSRSVTVLFHDAPVGLRRDAEAAADIALGMRLRSYSFDKYKTKKGDKDEPEGDIEAVIAVADPKAAGKAYKSRSAVAEGVVMARTLVNEPPNVLDPEEFARRAEQLEKLGVEVEVLDEKKLDKIGMRALLGVGQGSRKESRVVIMRWNGAKNKEKPLAFVGKGVCFDTGGISIKPAASMEDMKGDMAGAACVVGLMHALASRKAKANVIGAIGLVENMPSGEAQRPGDIVTSLSGQTIEIINTDAEGRLVLADVLWYVQDRFKPAFMVDLATLTGAVLVALGQENAGLFSNDDALAEKLQAASKATGEGVWRMPLSPAYDKIIDSKFADVKNSGGRHAGSVTAAQFLKRFVNDTPWAHLDIAGTAMGSPQSEINRGWASGWGVRLLDRLVADNYEG
ncbi:leucyl aminopeptidase [Alsobacter soli]|uniref:Probable cytosol aminopeptidase n=1 Tax=Alsobacter soli TaxID=2109933 RepID=A0A2T1HVN8_9HYPH|nr:leucyl aminopeptidase [Alsobacter soli]PSC05685.1 leucyl aminopeptidase [Alsobacter soli]